MRERRTDRGNVSERYVIERTLGHGGMATVYLAHDRTLDRPVALKVLAPHLADEQEFRDRFLREARLAAKLVHPNVVRVYDVGEDERGPFIVMEFIDGDTLAAELQRRGRLPPDEVVGVGIQLCSALAAAHAERLVHRDIKPQNILLRPDGQVKIADFGIARSLTATQHTEIGTVLGTAAYLAPEQAQGGTVTAAADIYSLGVVLYELLTGQTPFHADTLTELILKREQGLVTLPHEIAPGIPPQLEAVVMTCLAHRPEERPESAAALAGELAAAVGESPPEVTAVRATEILPANAATRVVRPPARGVRERWHELGHPRAVAAAVGLAALALIAAVAFANSGSDLPPPTTHAARASTTSTTTPTTTTTARAVRAPKAPSTPSQALAAARVALNQVGASGQLDPGSTNDLLHRLDDIAQKLAANDIAGAQHGSDDLLQRFNDLVKKGQLSGAVVSKIATPLNQLATLLAATPVPVAVASRPGHGHPHPPKGPKPKKH